MKALAYLVGWLLFLVMGAMAAFVCLGAIIAARDNAFIRNTLVAMDRLAAVFCGYTGRYTISAECGARNDRFNRLVRAVLDRLETGHCRRAALAEGLAPVY